MVVASALSVDPYSLADGENPDLAVVLERSKNRIQAMASIHEHFYRSGDVASIHFGQYIRTMEEEGFRWTRTTGETIIKA